MCENSLCISLYEDGKTKRCRWTPGSRGGSGNDWADFKLNRVDCSTYVPGTNFLTPTNCDCTVNAPKSVNKNGITGWPFEKSGSWQGINQFNEVCEGWTYMASKENDETKRLPDGVADSWKYSYGKTPLDAGIYI